MRLKGSPYKRISLEESIAFFQQGPQLFDIQCLQISSHVQDGIATFRAQGLDLTP
jgi:hypothetical protein